MAIEQSVPLIVSLACDRTTTLRRATCSVMITNVGPVPLLLNSRLLVAYSGNISREIYFELVRDGELYLGTNDLTLSLKNEREPLNHGHYRIVQPGEALTRWIRLDDYYEFLPSGNYRIRAVYESQPSTTSREAWSGTVLSNEIVLEVKARRAENYFPGSSITTVEPSELVSACLTCDRTTTEPHYGPITCTVRIANTSAARLVFNKRLKLAYEDEGASDLYFILVKDGKPYLGTDEFSFGSRSERLTPAHYQFVEPGEAISRRIQLDDYYRLPPGSYRIRAVYEPAPCESYEREVIEISREAWYGTVLSNEIVLDVQEASAHDARKASDSVGPLHVSLTCDRAMTPPRGPATCTVTVTNVGPAPLLLNKRFFINYPSNPICDLFFDILKDNAPYRGTGIDKEGEFSPDFKPRFLDPEDYQIVQPGESLARQVELDTYYRFPPGNYHIRAVYAPAPSDEGPSAWSGIARSNAVVLEVPEV